MRLAIATSSVALACTLLVGCGPRAHIPPRPLAVPGALADSSPDAILARALAPVLYLNPEERFPLERVVAVVHPTRQIIAYHLLWRDDVNGAWIPFTIPTDQEIVWVGFDSTGAPTDVWTYWHGTVLHADWRGHGQVAINVQWGKHGSLPRGVDESDLPNTGTLNVFYAFTWLSLPDIWLGRLTRSGPLCFCHGYGRYRTYDRSLPLAGRIDAVVRTQDPTTALTSVFGNPYSKKFPWP